eukprot:6325113-Pyramimonas_sp.AAC.1
MVGACGGSTAGGGPLSWPAHPPCGSPPLPFFKSKHTRLAEGQVRLYLTNGDHVPTDVNPVLREGDCHK